MSKNLNVQRLDGGVIEVTTGAPESNFKRTHGPSAVDTLGPMSYEAGNGQTTLHSVQSVNCGSIKSGIEGDIMSTVRKSHGGAISSHAEIDETCTVEIGGMRTDVQTAARLGAIQVDSQGNYYDSENPAIAEEEARETTKELQKASEPVIYTTPEATKYLRSLKAVHGDQMVDAILSKAVSALANGKSASSAVNEFSSLTGKESGESLEILNNVFQHLQGNVFNTAAKAYKVDAQELKEWFHTKLSSDIRGQMLNRFIHGDRQAMKDLMHRYRTGDRF
ncbi:MAG: hypothetical protein GY850_41345 [bacterium]|nr:hypothetical protein [bacterium]